MFHENVAEFTCVGICCRRSVDQSPAHSPAPALRARQADTPRSTEFTCVGICCRSSLDQSPAHSPAPALRTRQADTPLSTESPAAACDVTRDDSVVYSQTPAKKYGAKLKSQRRGHSFK